MLREFLDNILQFINSESLTDEEFDNLPVDLEEEYNKANYEALRHVLATRDSVDDDYIRLTNYFKAAGLKFSKEEAQRKPISNILIGRVLG